MAPAQIITVSGLPGSGTSTACGQLCTRLAWAYVDAGQIFRQLARESGLSLAEFGQRAEADARIDRQLDGRMVARAQAEAPIVLEGRLTGWMAHRHDLAAFKVWLAAAAEIRAQHQFCISIASRQHHISTASHHASITSHHITASQNTPHAHHITSASHHITSHQHHTNITSLSHHKKGRSIT